MPVEKIPSMERKRMSLEEAELFVTKNIFEIPIGERNRRCVDGRYLPEWHMAPVARPGGDAGYLMVTAAAIRKIAKEKSAKIDPANFKRILDQIIDFCGGPLKASIHSDKNALRAEKESAKPHIFCGGCGHVKQARISAENGDSEPYGLDKDDMALIDEVIEQVGQAKIEAEKEGRADLEPETELPDDHGELAVFVVRGRKYGVKPRTESGEQAFIYNETLDEDILKEISKIIRVNLSSLNVQLEQDELDSMVIEVSKQQTGETLKRLAKTLPIFYAESEDKEEGLVVRSGGFVSAEQE